MSTLTPAKTGKKTLSIGSEDVDPITPVREKFAKELRPKGRLPHLSNVTAAIQKELDTIRTFMRYCKQAIEHGDQKLLSSTLITRRDFDVVQAKYGFVGSGKRCVVFRSIPNYEEEEFDITPLIKLPPELADIFCTKTHKSGLIEYDALFEMSYVLHDSILIPFLANLKNHLLDVKSCLFEIHEWLSKPATNMPFIEQAFGVGTVELAERIAKTNPVCARCGHRYKSHNSSCRYNSVCPGAKLQFKRSSALNLKLFYTDSRINESFTLSDRNQRAKLLKLIQFISHE